MEYRGMFGRPFEDWKRDAKEFADFFKGMAAEGLHQDFEPGCGCKFHMHEPFSGFDFYHPRTNIFVSADRSLVFEFLLPGFDEKGVSVTFKGDKMILRARLPEGEPKIDNPRWERRSFTIRDVDWREYSVPAERYDQAAARAAFRNGILTVTIPARGDEAEEGVVRIEIVKEGN